jgi:hypothetical protein
MSKVKTITLNGKVSEYDVKYTKAYVAKIISAQADLYQELNSVSLPYNTVKEIYVDGILEAELVGSNLLYVQKRPKHDPYVDRHEPEEVFDEDHALDMVMNNMLEDFTDEEIEEMMKPESGIYLQNVTAPPPYWVTDTTAGNVDITYTN